MTQAKWRRAVFKRNDYTCQICEDRNKKGKGKSITLNAHYLESYNSNRELRYDIYNGITLCKNCHKNVNSTYGYGNNTKEQFEEYLNNYKKGDDK